MIGLDTAAKAEALRRFQGWQQIRVLDLEKGWMRPLILIGAVVADEMTEDLLSAFRLERALCAFKARIC
jgi:hypothetical protein